MNGNGMRWFAWIADHTQYFFWGVWGAGAGAFGLVLFRAIDMSGVSAPIYLGFLTVAMSAMAALATNRSMDNLTDRRKVRRRLYSVLPRVSSLIWELEGLQDAVDAVKATKTVALDGTNLTFSEANIILNRCVRIAQRAEPAPDFEDLVQTEADANAEHLCRSNFIFCADHYKIGNLRGMPEPWQQQQAAIFVLQDGDVARAPDSPGEALTRVSRHLRARLDDLR